MLATHMTDGMEQSYARLCALQSDEERRKIKRCFKSGAGDYGEGDIFIGVRMGDIFALAKEFVEMPPAEIEALLESPIHELRAGACSIMAKQFGLRRVADSGREVLFNLYVRRHARINNCDLVDLAARQVIGGWLLDRPRDLLYQFARSTNLGQRRTAMPATMQFLRKNRHDDTYAIAEILLDDPEDLIHKVAGGVPRFAGDKGLQRLLAFLDINAAAMPRQMLRTAVEHLDKADKSRYLVRQTG